MRIPDSRWILGLGILAALAAAPLQAGIRTLVHINGDCSFEMVPDSASRGTLQVSVAGDVNDKRVFPALTKSSKPLELKGCRNLELNFDGYPDNKLEEFRIHLKIKELGSDRGCINTMWISYDKKKDVFVVEKKEQVFDGNRRQATIEWKTTKPYDPNSSKNNANYLFRMTYPQ